MALSFEYLHPTNWKTFKRVTSSVMDDDAFNDLGYDDDDVECAEPSTQNEKWVFGVALRLFSLYEMSSTGLTQYFFVNTI